MKWQRKAQLQRLVARLPSRLSYAVYYMIQRNFGRLRSEEPISRLTAGINILDRIQAQGHTIEGKTFLEVGTGRRLVVPMALWLGGASRVITVDTNPYLKAELVFEDITYMKNNRAQIESLFHELSCTTAFSERLAHLMEAEYCLERLLDLMNIHYLAAADAASLQLPPETIDYHVSYTVLEHIPPGVLRDVLVEGKRLLGANGLFVHYIDFSDHFSHSDPSITAINFLQFSEIEWQRYAGNRYMYHNRLRVDDIVAMFETLGLDIRAMDTIVDRRSLGQLSAGFPLDARFRGKSDETNATVSAWIVASMSTDETPRQR